MKAASVSGLGVVVSLGLWLLAACAPAAKAHMPNPYGPNVNTETAKKVAEAALAEARKNNWTMAAAVVDTSGVLVYFERIDNTQNGSSVVAIDKAKSAALFKRPTKALQDALAAGGEGWRVLKIEGSVPLEGGIPLISDGKIIGALGVSGGASAQDGQCAKAGADSLK
jgi:glc operon protein GlcG